jgi:hypothetical protein
MQLCSRPMSSLTCSAHPASFSPAHRPRVPAPPLGALLTSLRVVRPSAPPALNILVRAINDSQDSPKEEPNLPPALARSPLSASYVAPRSRMHQHPRASFQSDLAASLLPAVLTALAKAHVDRLSMPFAEEGVNMRRLISSDIFAKVTFTRTTTIHTHHHHSHPPSHPHQHTRFVSSSALRRGDATHSHTSARTHRTSLLMGYAFPSLAGARIAACRPRLARAAPATHRPLATCRLATAPYQPAHAPHSRLLTDIRPPVRHTSTRTEAHATAALELRPTPPQHSN